MRNVLKGTLLSIAPTLAAVAARTLVDAPALAQFGGPPPPPNTGVPLYAAMTGWAERPSTGDANGAGAFTVVVDPPKGTACYLFPGVTGIEPATAAHIHRGGPNEAGPPVITLEAPGDGSSGGCAPIAADLAQAMLANPGGYYVNVHNATFPQGAIRGQLRK